MCTRHRKYFRKVLIEKKTFADNFSFQLYPIAKIRLRFKSPCTKSAQSLPIHSKTASSPLSAQGHNWIWARGSLVCWKTTCRASVLKHTWACMKDIVLLNWDMQTSHRAFALHRSCASWVLYSIVFVWMTANHHTLALCSGCEAMRCSVGGTSEGRFMIKEESKRSFCLLKCAHNKQTRG